MNFSPLLTACVFSFFLFSSCKKEEPDRIKPVIIGISSFFGDTIYSDQSLRIEYSVTDETDLSQLKFEVKNVGGTPSEDTTVSQYWEHIEIKDITGTESPGSVSLVIPQNVAAGNYIVAVTAVDGSGNSSLPDTLAIVIRNSTDLSSPVVIITNPVEGAIIDTDSALILSGEVSDNTALSRLKIRVFTAGAIISTSSDEYSAVQLELNNDLNAETWLPGNYIIEVTVFDRVLNKTVATRNVVKQ